MATTTNFGWETPDDTDLVKDGALAMRTLGNAIDTSLVDLKGGTTGQVLSKTSNTDMDFTWVTSDDANAIQNAIVDAKGDLIAASAADTPARLAVGNNGETLVADSSATTGLSWQGNFAAGKNKVINGDFRIWQRGTSFTGTSTNGFAADRFKWNTGSAGTSTVSQQTFTAGTAPVAGYEGQFFLRHNRSTASTTVGNGVIWQQVEDVRTLAGQTVTFSFWAKAGANKNFTVNVEQDFGSGGSGGVVAITQTFAVTTSWQRFTFTGTMPSISGKTIGSNSSVYLIISEPTTLSTFTLDTWGWQLEAGSVATAFQTATGTLAGEYAACARYYQKSYDLSAAPGNDTITGIAYSAWSSGGATTGYLSYEINYPVRMRTAPTVTTYDVLENSGKVSRTTPGVGDQNNITPSSSFNSESRILIQSSSGNSHTGLVFHWTASAEL